MKKWVSLFLAFAMLFALSLPVFAADSEAQEAAQMLYDLGLFKGTGVDVSGNPIFDLNRAPTRAEAVTMLVRLLGKEDEALAGDWNTPFTDVAGWVKPYAGYAYANGLTAGVSETHFGGEKPVTAAQFLTFTLRALGYESGRDFSWNTAWTLADTLGITNGQYNIKTNGGFLRADAALVSCLALGANGKTGKTLYETIFGKSMPQTLSDTIDRLAGRTPKRETSRAAAGYGKYLDTLHLPDLLGKPQYSQAEIRQMLEGECTLADGMVRQMERLCARRTDLDEAISFCERLQREPGSLSELDVEQTLARLSAKEEQGVSFVNIEQVDRKAERIKGALVGAGLFTAIMLLTMGITAWAIWMDPQDMPPLPLLVLLFGIPAGCILGTLKVLEDRIREIRKGEEDAYRNY